MKNILAVMVFLFITVFTSVSIADDAPWRCDALQNDYLPHNQKFSTSQMETMYRSFEYAREDDLGWTLAAIAFRESSAGVRLKNPRDPSAGAHHVLATHVLNDFGMGHTQENINMAMDMLASNFELSAHYAMRELKWWLNRHNGNWFLAVRSYNQGYFWLLTDPKDRQRSYNYARNVQDTVRFMMQHCEWNNQ